jgi:hypothetical protein
VSGDLVVALTSPPAAEAEGGTESLAFSVLEPAACKTFDCEWRLHFVHAAEGVSDVCYCLYTRVYPKVSGLIDNEINNKHKGYGGITH